MHFVQIESMFESAHSLRQYDGKCKRIHGHNFKVVATLKSEKLDQRGMVVDFLDLEKELNHILERFDHRYLNEIPPFDNINPTVEELSKYIFSELQKVFTEVQVDKVMVYETDKYVATYTES